jgi:hypothetical protein
MHLSNLQHLTFFKTEAEHWRAQVDQGLPSNSDEPFDFELRGFLENHVSWSVLKVLDLVPK